MDFHAAMETFAEAWVAANTHTAVNSDPSSSEPTQTPTKSLPSNEPPTTLPKEKTTSQKSLMSEKGGGKESPSSSKNEGTKSLPVHCVIEQVSGVPSFDGSGCNNTTQELDSYAILPSTTTLNDLVRVALTKLGYSPSDSLNARGAIHFKNWKPLTFDKITDNLQATVEDILGDLINVATLKIRICSEPSYVVEWTDEHVRCAVVELLQEMSQSKLAFLSPLSQSTISNISNGKYCNKIGTRTCIHFGRWYHQYRLQPQAVLSSSQTSIKDSRMTFHPEHEVPVMKNWFMSNYSPSDEKLAFYAEQLNQGPIRSSRPKVTVMRLKNWWKNERQKEKKQQRESTESTTPTQRRGRRSQTTKNLINLDSGSEVNLIQHGQIAEAHSQLQPSSDSYYSHSTYNYR